MRITNDIIQKIRQEPKVFADILSRMNEGRLHVHPSTLMRRLERQSEVIVTNSIIVEYFRELGYEDEQIFEKELEK